MAPTHRGCALLSVTDHHHRQLLSADHFHHGLLRHHRLREFHGLAARPRHDGIFAIGFAQAKNPFGV
jgi:hypothetical protein